MNRIAREPMRFLRHRILRALTQDTTTDADTGLVIDEGFALLKGQCTGCHSAKLITHSGKTREGRIDTIPWMQRNHGLGALGSTEEPIVSYLVKHYPVPTTAPWRRPPLRAHLMPKQEP